MNRFLAFLLLVFINVQMDAQAQQQILKDALEKAEKQDFSGIILIATDGKISYEKTMGMRSYEHNIVLQKNDIFELASLSKQFTAMMVMICKEKGLLEFDDPLSDYLDLPYSGISIRNLLTHTSGLPDYQAIMDQHWDKSKVAGNPEILEYLRKYAPPISFVPSEKYEYSNTGYVLLASVVEIVTGRDFVDLSKEWIFDPLDMSSTRIRTPEEKVEIQAFAVGQLLNKDGNYVNANNFRDSDYTIWLGNRKGPGRVSSNASDLLKWDQALYSELLVSNETLEEAFTPFKLSDGTLSYYGFGWEIEPKSRYGKMVRHTGDNPGYKTLITRCIDENKTIIILNNNAHSAAMDILEAATLSLRKW